MALAQRETHAETVGRYALYGMIAQGGMATVCFGRLVGHGGFSRAVAIKRLHPRFAADPEVRAMFLDEARLASRIRHPSVVTTLDVVSEGGELSLVMEYVHGESLARLMRAAWERRRAVPLPIVRAVMANVLHGLHAAHEARSERGEALGIVHRDVSPQNVIVGVDGVARVLDFGVARATQAQRGKGGVLEGKLAYMAPEQLGVAEVTRRADVYAAAVVLWELVAGRRLFRDADATVVAKLLRGVSEAPSAHRRDPNAAALDAIALCGLAREPEARFATAREMAIAIERSGPVATTSEVGAWVEAMATEALDARALRIAEIERESSHVRVTSEARLSAALLAKDDALDALFVGAEAKREPASPMPGVLATLAVGRALRSDDRRARLVLLGAALAALFAIAIFLALMQ